MTSATDPDLAACGHALGPRPVTAADGSTWCCVFCAAVARPAIELKLLLARADAMEAAQAEARRLHARALGPAMLNGKK
jgi:hypothetical protein